MKELPPLPEPHMVINSNCHDPKLHWSAYTVEQMREYANLVREELLADAAEALMHDCESGVKWLNKQAHDKFARDYPNLRNVLNGSNP